MEEDIPEDPMGFCEAIVPLFLCGQADACETAAAGVSCEQLTNPTANRYPALCGPHLLQNLDAGIVTFDPAAARACVAQWRTVCGSRGCLGTVFRGTLDVGAACRSNYDCRADAFCQVTTQCPGTCAPLLPDGDEPSDLSACQSGHGAYLVDGGARCGSLLERGASCAPAGDVVTPLACALGLACLNGRCQTPLQEGASCTALRLASECDLGLVCLGGTCRRRSQLGESCADTWCLDGLRCNADRVCASPASLGESCSSTPDCRAPLSCEAGVCALLQAEGSPCSVSWECESKFICTQGACALPVPLGGVCSEVTACGNGLTCSSGRCVLASCG